MSIRVVEEVELIEAKNKTNFQQDVNRALANLHAAGRNVADVRYVMSCHHDGTTEYTALIIIGG